MNAALLFLFLAQQPPVVFRADLSIVAVDAQVVEGSRIIGGLHREDFAILENGKPQEVLYFGEDAEPLDLLLLLDLSGSMTPVVAAVAADAHRALAQLQPGDRVGVMTFDRHTNLVEPLTADRGLVERRLVEIVKTRGGTNLNGAVYDAGAYFLKQPRRNARRSVLVLTDNVGLKSKRDRTVIRELWEGDAVLNALLFRDWLGRALKYSMYTSPYGVFGQANVKKIVAQTGGESLDADAPADSFAAMIERIRKRYTLHYRAAPGPAGQVRSIQVDLSGEAKKRFPEARVRARRGYVLK